MSSAQSPTGGSPRPATLISGFVERYRMVLLVAAGAVLAALVIWLVWSERERSVQESSALRAEQLQELFAQWQAAPEGTRKTNLGDRLLEEVAQLERQFPRRYAAQRALYVRAQYRFELQQWDDAVADWLEVATRWPASYLAAFSMFNAAVAVEEAGEAEAAAEHLQRVIEEWNTSVLVPRALFSVGRLAEQQADYGAAKAAYDRLTDEHGGSSWATAARNRLIALETQGRLAAE